MSEKGRVEAPRICVKCGHEERFSDNEAGYCYKKLDAEIRGHSAIADCGCYCQFPQPPTADAEMEALEIVRSLYNVNCFECSDVFCTHWQSSAASIIYDALSAAKQQGRDEQREAMVQRLRAMKENFVPVNRILEEIDAAAIRSNQ